jgi:ppGpp synthetase/RelA/SpoT-type nucleotidyltranferase
LSSKPTLDEYLASQWVARGLPTGQEYMFNMRSVVATLSQSEFMTGLDSELRSAAREYAADDRLLFGIEVPKLEPLIKPFSSLQNKCFRQNCLDNDGYPDAPPGGWIDGHGIYTRINDLMRSRLICRYMDGPQYLCERLEVYCNSLNLSCRYSPKSNDRGYYAWHFYLHFPSEVMLGTIQNIQLDFEIQITTQLADVLAALTHGLYEDERISPGQARADEWKWDSEAMKFKTAYMGHTLHMLEGSILRIKNDVAGARPTVNAEKRPDDTAASADIEGPASDEAGEDAESRIATNEGAEEE